MDGKKRPEKRDNGSEKGKYKAILFDKDGVLVDSLDLCLRAANETLQHFGRPEMDREEFRTVFWGTRADKNFDKHFGEINREKADEIYDYYNRKKLEFREMAKLFPGVRDVLESLRGSGRYKLGIVTSSFGDVSRTILEELGVMQYFDVMVSGKETEPKPAPDPIVKACDALGVEPVEAVYVGDTIPDIKAGRAAGCKVVFVTNSLSRDEIADVDGIEDVTVIGNLKELLDIVL